MSLKKSVVIVNEYTVKNGAKSGSRGGTPGDYVLRYMSRDGATEGITPAKLHELDDYVTKYMAREDAVESADDVPELKHRFKKVQKYGGVAFSNNDVALSDEKLMKVSNDIQQMFEMGKTCMKTVISFDEEYLRENGIIEEDFVCEERGDYRGHIDQMKLRMAIMNGLGKMQRYYDDLKYVGVIQVDTKHVHCHLAMVDAGKGKLAADGTQKGKITALSKRTLRRGIDTFLDQKQDVKMMASSISYDKRNTLCYVKKFTHRMMSQQGLPQFLIACLPQNRQLWRASTNRKEMRKPNAIVRDYVRELLEQPDSGYDLVMKDVVSYAEHRSKREGLSTEETNKLIRDGQNDVIERCMNGVYSVLMEIPEEEQVIRTPMLETMSMDYDDMAGQAINDPMMEFGFKLRSYSSRMKHHKEEYHKYRDEYNRYEDTEDKSKDSDVLGEFLRMERNYNAMLMVKYQYFLSFLPSDENLEDEFDELMEEKEKLKNLRRMSRDRDIKRMSYNQAEDYGLTVYGQHGGGFVKANPTIINKRIKNFTESVMRKESAFRDKVRDCGMDYDGKNIIQRKMYKFDDIKALDLHHLGYDFPYDVQVSKVNIDKFKKMADVRYDSFQAAKAYLVRTDQDDAIKSLPETDVMYMKQYADSLIGKDTLKSTRPNSGQNRKTYTISLGNDYTTDIKTMVKSAVKSVVDDGYPNSSR